MAKPSELKGFEELGSMLDPKKFKKRLVKNVKEATVWIASIAEGEIKKSISAGGYLENSPVTEILKRNNKPLVSRSGELDKNIIGIAHSWDVARIGVLRNKMVTDKNGRSSDILMIAKIVHDGATVPVSDAMRRLFWWWAYGDTPGKESPYLGEVIPLSKDTTEIIIEGRPFLLAALKKKAKAKYMKRWNSAVNKSFSGKRR